MPSGSITKRFLERVSNLRSRAEPRASTPTAALYVPWLAGCLPLAYYVAGASSHGGFYEEGSFVAAARGFGVSHPPGAPVQALVTSAFALLPIGPLPFRVAIASALCAALTLALFARALLGTLSHVGVTNTRLAAALALATSLWLGQTPLFFQQATRPQLFSLQFALSMLIVYTLLRFEAEEPSGSTRVLYFGAFVQGLCFANHHVYGLLMLPAAAPTLGRVFAKRGFIGLMGHVAAPIVGFSAFLYVPLRLAHQPEASFAGESSFTRLLSMLAAEPYWGPSWAAPVPVLATLREGLELTNPILLAGFLLLVCTGLWVTLRSSHRRRFGTLWFLALAVPLLSVRWALHPRLEEDAWGALLPCAFGLGAIAACGAGRLLSGLAALSTRTSQLCCVLPLLFAGAGWVSHDASEDAALNLLGDRLDELTRRTLPVGSVLYADDAGSAFRHRGREAEEALRADVTLVPLAWRQLPHAIDDWAKNHPELSDSLRALVLNGALAPGPLQSLSALRPVYVEPGDGLPEALYETTLDQGLFLRVVADGATPAELRGERTQQALRLGRLYPLPGRLGPTGRGALLRLGRTHFFQALQRATLADRDGARDYLKLSARAGFRDPRMDALDAALRTDKRLDLEPYLKPEELPP